MVNLFSPWIKLNYCSVDVKQQLINESIHIKGAVKITPAHDYTDFDVGQRHNLPSRSVISNAGTMENCSEPFLGLKRFDCRKELGKVLADKGLLRESESHAMSVPVCRYFFIQ